MKLLVIILFLIKVSCFLMMFPGDKKNNAVKATSRAAIGANITSKPIIVLPERQIKVYIGIADSWHEMASPANYSKWNYVRTNAAGFYTNFIVMWSNNHKNIKDPQVSCNDMRKAFINNGCFFETSLETRVNDAANGGNNEATDKESIDMLTNAGFIVDNTSLNYGVDAARVNTLRTYRNERNCLALQGPWTIGGDVLSDSVSINAQIRRDIISTDGIETDGPLGFWSIDWNKMREGSYSLAQFARQNKRLSAIMLAPADGGITTYNPTTDFFSAAKQCVLNHEDNNASPDMWTIWTYGERSDEPTFPESVVNSNGQTVPANTLMGVGYWLLKHLNNLPKVQIKNTGAVTKAVSVKVTDSAHAEIRMNKASGSNISYRMPITFSNDPDAQVEISPVIQAVISGAKNGWDISFTLAGRDVTDDVIYDGGLNCIKSMRLSNSNKLTLMANIKAKNTHTALPISIKIKTMSNIANTKNVNNYTIVAKVL